MKHDLPITYFSSGTSTVPTPSHDAKAASEESSLFSEMVDAVNPLHHVPIISSAYRAATGETVSLGARIVGGGIFGGVIGAATSLVLGVAEQIQGEPLERTAMDALGITTEDTPYTVAQPLIHDLSSDHGEAMLRMAQEQAFSQAHQAEVQRQQAGLPLEPLHLSESRDHAMGLTNTDKVQQLTMRLHDELLEKI